MTERGALYTMAAKAAYTGKPRPAPVLQTEALTLDSVIVAPTTSLAVDAQSIRIALQPDPDTGLDRPCWVMSDKIVAVPVRNLGRRIGRIDAGTLRLVEEAIRLLLDLDG